MSTRDELIAEARGWAEWNRKISLTHNQNQRRLLNALADALEAAERKPVIDREALARVLDEEYDHYSPTYSEQGECVNSTMADAVIASGLIEDKREAQAEALEAFAALEIPAAAEARRALLARAAEIREGRA